VYFASFEVLCPSQRRMLKPFTRLIRTRFCNSQTEMSRCCTRGTWGWEEIGGSLSAADGAAGVPDWPSSLTKVKTFYNFFGHSVERRTRHSKVQTRMQETVRHLKKGIVTRCVCAPVKLFLVRKLT
jgi:hypothetical protein